VIFSKAISVVTQTTRKTQRRGELTADPRNFPRIRVSLRAGSPLALHSQAAIRRLRQRLQAAYGRQAVVDQALNSGRKRRQQGNPITVRTVRPAAMRAGERGRRNLLQELRRKNC
jgi:hypothetical protein